MPNIYQLLPTVSYGDAVSNDALAMSDAITQMGYDNKIFAVNIDPRIKEKVYNIEKLSCNKEDMIIFHMSIGSELSQKIAQLPNRRKIMIYHNITPENYFLGYNSVSYDLCKKGREQLELLRDSFDLCLAVSEYNKKELDELGYRRTEVLPIILNFEDYKKKPDEGVIKKCSDGYVNIVFVGRLAPNKKQDDIIRSFYVYKKYINPNSRLFIIGSYNGMEKYYNELNELVSALGLKDVYILGQTSFKDILAYYSVASVFLCMSEHEGFCVPLLESMFFKVPIIAYESSAIPETLANSGIIIREKRYKVIAELIDLVVRNQELRNKVISAQSRRLEDFNSRKIKEQFKQYMAEVL